MSGREATGGRGNFTHYLSHSTGGISLHLDYSPLLPDGGVYLIPLCRPRKRPLPTGDKFFCDMAAESETSGLVVTFRRSKRQKLGQYR